MPGHRKISALLSASAKPMFERASSSVLGRSPLWSWGNSFTATSIDRIFLWHCERLRSKLVCDRRQAVDMLRKHIPAQTYIMKLGRIGIYGWLVTQKRGQKGVKKGSEMTNGIFLILRSVLAQHWPPFANAPSPIASLSRPNSWSFLSVIARPTVPSKTCRFSVLTTFTFVCLFSQIQFIPFPKSAESGAWT
jgi:hypothetical protein